MRGSLSRAAASSRARGDGSTSASRTRRPSALERIFWVTTTTSKSAGAMPARSIASPTRRATSSPSRTMGMPARGIRVTGRTRVIDRHSCRRRHSRLRGNDLPWAALPRTDRACSAYSRERGHLARMNNGGFQATGSMTGLRPVRARCPRSRGHVAAPARCAPARTATAHPTPERTSGTDESRSNRLARRYTGSSSVGAPNAAARRSSAASA